MRKDVPTRLISGKIINTYVSPSLLPIRIILMLISLDEALCIIMIEPQIELPSKRVSAINESRDGYDESVYNNSSAK